MRLEVKLATPTHTCTYIPLLLSQGRTLPLPSPAPRYSSIESGPHFHQHDVHESLVSQWAGGGGWECVECDVGGCECVECHVGGCVWGVMEDVCGE